MKNIEIYRRYSEFRLRKLGLNPNRIKSYDSVLRHFHNFEHIATVLEHLRVNNCLDNNVLFLTAIYHDIVYDPQRVDNEKRSAALFYNDAKKTKLSSNEILLVTDIILETKIHEVNFSKDNFELYSKFFDADMSVLRGTYEQLVEYEYKIRKEYNFLVDDEYLAKRIQFLESIKHCNSNISKLIELLKESILAKCVE